MASDGSVTRARELFARMGELLLELFAGEDRRVRLVIARVAATAYPGDGSELRARWHAGPAVNPQVE